MAHSDKQLGMYRDITRRDFLQGTSALLVSPFLSNCSKPAIRAYAPEQAAAYYPPTLTGMRGNHEGSFEVAHALILEGAQWSNVNQINDVHYDLVVVGGGISGLASAYQYREEMGNDAKILILDNHDDFGGHAKRNEFHLNEQMRIALGGSMNLEYQGYNPETRELFRKLGVDFKKLTDGLEFSFGSYGGLDDAVYFDAETYGRDVLIKGIRRATAKSLNKAKHLIKDFPISKSAQDALIAFLESNTDVLAPMTDEQKREYLDKTSYRDFLLTKVQLPEEAVQFFDQALHGLWGASTEGLPVSECLKEGLPGANVLGLANDKKEAAVEKFRYAMFPDGNASVARLLVRALVPGVADGDSMEDIVTAKFKYAKLDSPESRVQIRLNSTVISAKNNAESGVEVDYIRGEKAYRVRANQCVLACYHHIIPYICPDLPEEQKKAIEYPVKSPLLVSNVLLKDGQAFEKLGVNGFYSPGRFHAGAWIAGGISVGQYDGGWQPTIPTVLQFFGAATVPGDGNTMKEQYRKGQHRLYNMTFTEIERELRIHLAGMLKDGDFDPARDIEAITVNRWPHGYAYEYSTLEDPKWEKGQAPHEIARRRFGQIAIANSDAMAYAYVSGAIEAALLAIKDLGR